MCDLYDLREALERHAVATADVDAGSLAALRDSINRMRSSLDRSNKSGFINEDVCFHTLLAGAGGNRRLSDLLERIQLQVWLFRRKSYNLSLSYAMPEHEAIVDALAKRDKGKAEQAIREHISNVRERLLTSASDDREPRARAAGVSV
jgi:DNA-binding GntR family transcriptional regulator